jgi:8-oxo-dGTP diphosphatase
MNMFSILVGIIPYYDGKILITQRSMSEKFMPGAWGLPCGKIDFGESLEDAVARELLEETGLEGEICSLVGYSMFVSQKDGNNLHNVQINYSVNLSKQSPVILDKSSQAFHWVTLDDPFFLELDEFTRSTILQSHL